MSVVRAIITGNLTVRESFSNAPGASTNTNRNFVTMDAFDNEHTLEPTGTTPDADDSCHFEVTLSAGAATIDLTSISGPNSGTKNFNTKKIRAIKFRAKSTSAGAFTIVKGASNGFTGFGANFSVTLPANAAGGAWMMFYDGGGGTVVSGTVKTLDVTGTGTQVLQVAVLAGD